MSDRTLLAAKEAKQSNKKPAEKERRLARDRRLIGQRTVKGGERTSREEQEKKRVNLMEKKKDNKGKK